MNNQYKHAGKPLTPEIAQELIREFFAGQTVQKQEIVKAVDQAHLARAGQPAQSIHHPVTRALSTMKISGLSQNLRRGLWFIKPLPIKMLNDFLEWASQFDSGKYLFRGVSDTAYKIDSSAYRRVKRGRDEDEKQPGDFETLLKINRNLIREARFRGHDRKDGQKLEDLEVLAEFQHYGAATCLMDFTFNPLVALWFACKQKVDKSSNTPIDGKVVAVDPGDSIVPEVTQGFSVITLESLQKRIDAFFRDTAGNIREKLYQWQPRHQNNRIGAQQSIFLFGALEIDPNEECIIDGNNKEKIRESLQRIYGISEDMLFPDFDGFARQHSQEIPYTQLPASQYSQSGTTLCQRGEYQEAIIEFDMAINLNPHDPYSHHWRGVAKYNLGRYEEAITDFDEATTQNPNDILAYYNRGLAKHNLGRYEEAITDFDEAITRNLDYILTYYDRGVAKYNLGRYEEAITDFDTVITRDNNHTYSYHWRGLAKYSLNQYPEAIADFDEAITRDDNYRHAYYNRGLAKSQLNLREQAREDLQIALMQAVQANDADLIIQIEYLLNEIDSGFNERDSGQE